MRIGINGFGRIGRNFIKALIERHPIGRDRGDQRPDRAGRDARTSSNTTRTTGRIRATSDSDGDAVTIDGRKIKVLAERDPAKLPWRDLGVDVVDRVDRALHRRGHARAHTSTAAAREKSSSRRPPRTKTSRSCWASTTNATTPTNTHHLERIVHDELPRDRGQADRRRARLAQGIHDDGPLVHERSGAARRAAQGPAPRAQRRDEHHPDVDRRRQGAVPDDPRGQGDVRRLLAARPDADGLDDLSRGTGRAEATTKDEVNAILRKAAPRRISRNTSSTPRTELVSSDFKRSPYSSIVDSALTNANGDLVQIAAWYDNEWGYSCRLADVTAAACSRDACPPSLGCEFRTICATSTSARQARSSSARTSTSR